MSEAMPNGRTKQLISSAARRARDRQLVENLKALQRGDSAPLYLDSVAPIECEFDWVEGLIEALERIATEHVSYDEAHGQYGIGVVDGHRCAATVARAALAAIPKGENE